jgi:hypothetical protein
MGRPLLTHTPTESERLTLGAQAPNLRVGGLSLSSRQAGKRCRLVPTVERFDR